MTHYAAPALAAGGKLHFAFGEDDVTLAHDAVQAAGLKPGATLRAEGATLPGWFWAGTGLVQDAGAPRTLQVAHTGAGPVAFVTDTGPVQEEALARAALTQARAADAAELARIAKARDAPDGEADFPLGAHVMPSRHDQVLVERMRFGPAKVVSWTQVGAGAAPSKFTRLQEAQGAYFVVLVERADGKRTVGIWDGAAPKVGQAAKPIVRRLLRQQGAWRYGVLFTAG